MTLFETPEDRDRQRAIARTIEERCRCKVHEFGYVSPIDWYIARDERMTAVAELKERTNASTAYATVFLSARKFLGLVFGSMSLGVPGLFFVQWTDRLGYVDAMEVWPVKQPILRNGRRHDYRTANDIEPIIEVPVERFHWL